jgi:hypothetical protein
MSKRTEAERHKAADQLRDGYGLEPGSVVLTLLRHVSRSGMTRDISVYLPDPDGGIPANVSGLVARATGNRFGPDRDAVRIGGAGMDMGFALVYDLSRVMFRDGFHCTGTMDCPANDHVNDRDWTGKGHTTDRVHSDPGYALVQRWMS